MRKPDRCLVGGASVAILMALWAGPAAAGEYAVANCQADPLNFSTRAFEDFATRGMKIRRACDPEGPGMRGLITANVARGGQVPRGSVAWATMTAPVGTRFKWFRWAGTARRDDCRYALQIWADGPGVAPIPIKNVRANQQCPLPRLGQFAGYASRSFPVDGATRIVQRVICVGGKERKSCSARGRNYLRTYEAEVQIVDVLAPAASIIGDTPLARGEWVRGVQPLNYDASDNVGVRLADAIAAGRVRRLRRSARARSPRRSARSRTASRARTVPATSALNTTDLRRGHTAACRAGAGHCWQRRRLARR